VQWNWVDLVLLLLLISALVGGYRRGLTQIVSGWLGLIIGFLAAVILFKPLKLQLLDWLGLNQMASVGAPSPVATIILSALMTVVAFALILIIVNILFRLLGRVIHNLIDTIGLAWVDGGLGAVITLFLTMIVIALLVGMGKPLLQMGATAHWDWAIAASKEMDTAKLQPVFMQIYQQWGDWVKPHV